MKKLTIIAEAWLTDDEAKELAKKPKLIWNKDAVIAHVCGKEIKFVSASIQQ